MMPIFSFLAGLRSTDWLATGELTEHRWDHKAHPLGQWVSLGLLLALVGSISLQGCASSLPQAPDSQLSQSQPSSTEPATAPATPTSQATNDKTTLSTLKFKQGSGAAAFSLKIKADGAKWVNSADQEMARLKVDGNQKVKIKDAQDKTLGYVVKTGDHWKLENADQSQELYVFRQQADGDYKLEDGQGQQVYRIKARAYGYEIETPDQQSLYKVKAKDGKTSLRTAQDETLLSTKDAIAPIALAAFGFEVLTPEQQAALAYAVNLTGGQ